MCWEFREVERLLPSWAAVRSADLQAGTRKVGRSREMPSWSSALRELGATRARRYGGEPLRMRRSIRRRCEARRRVRRRYSTFMSLEELSPRFVFPVGSQVVLTREVGVLGGGGGFKKAGSVGRVADAPLTNEYSYLVEFADGTQVRARRGDLVLHRSDQPLPASPERPWSAYEAHVVYAAVMGSVAYGLADEGSDVDERGVFVPPAEWHWSLQPLPEQVEFDRPGDDGGRGADVCWWEIEKFVRLALKGNPAILELLWVPERCLLRCEGFGNELRGLRDAFLSRYLYRTYSGYVLSQFKRMRRDVERGRPIRPKHAMHLVRLLQSGIAAVEGRGIQVNVGEHREELLRIKRREVPFEVVHERALELDAVFDRARERSPLSERPDVERVDAWLVSVRRRKAEGG